jgi:lysyl-tRNA synthetase class 2
MVNNTEFNINNERETRLKKFNDLKELGINSYPAQSKRLHSLSVALEKSEGEEVSVAGRIMTKREMGKLTFCHLQDESARMQIVFKQDEVGKEEYKLFVKKIDSADIISVEGERFVTQKGEQSILVKKWTLLSKALLPLPDKFHGLQDEELRLRKRYIDMLVDSDLKEAERELHLKNGGFKIKNNFE